MDHGTILYVGNFQLPDHGASANRVVTNGKLFRMLGFRTVFLGVADDRFSGIREHSPGMYEERCPKGTLQWAQHMVSVRNIRRLASMYPDLCMIILYNVPYVLLQRVKHAFPNIRIVYDCTEWTDVTEGSFLKRKAKKADERLIRTRIDKKADGLIVVSTRMYRSYQSEAMLLLPPLVDTEDPIWHQDGKKVSSSFEFCFAGLPDGNKDSMELMVRAFAALPENDTLLRIIGVEKTEFLRRNPEAEDTVNHMGNRVLFMGRRSHAETLRYEQNADCNLIIREADRRNNAGFPTKFAEAFTVGKAIITTDISDVNLYASRVDNAFVVDFDENAVRMAMENVLKRRDGAAALRADFHFATYAPACEQWLSRLLLEKPSC